MSNANQKVVAPFGGECILAGYQGGTQLNTDGQAAGLVPTTTGNPANPYAFQALPTASGTVTSVAVATAHGFQGTVSNPNTTPSISLQTTVAAGLVASDGAGDLVAADGSIIGVPVLQVVTVPLTPGSNVAVPSGLSIGVVAGATYSFEIFYYISITAPANDTINLNSGTATMTSVRGWGQNLNIGGSQSNVAISAYTTTMTDTSAAGVNVTQVVTGTFVVNAGGVFEPGYATANLSTDTLLAGSWMRVTRIS